MEKVKNEVLKKVQGVSYHGFLCYLIKNNQEIRNMILSRLLVFYDIESTVIYNQKSYIDAKCYDYYLDLREKDGNSDYFDFAVNEVFEDLVVFWSIKSQYPYRFGEIDAKMQYNLYIVCDSKDEVFDQYITKDSDLKKVVVVDPKTLKVTDENILEFHLAVQLDCIDEIEIEDDFDHFMYLLKHNKPYDENHHIYKTILAEHTNYQNSKRYEDDFKYEFDELIKTLHEEE